jgi:hypothetical protein
MSDKVKKHLRSGVNSVWEKAKKFVRFTLTIILIMSISYFIIEDVIKKSETIFAVWVSEESEFQVNLTNDTKYELWVLEFYGGPEEINVSVKKDSYTAFEDKFMLMHPEGDYLPYHPDFTVKENGTYQVHAKPLDSGSAKIVIRKIHGFSTSFI